MNDRPEVTKAMRKLASLGVASYSGITDIPVDPEKTILELLKCYWSHNDHFFFIFSLMKHRIHSLIHVERLVSLAQSSMLSDDEIILLIALSNKMVEIGDLRFSLVGKKLKKKGMVLSKVPENEDSKHLIKLWGTEKTLEPFGVKVRSFYEQDTKKFFVMKKILADHPWLKIRALVGPNYRADIIYLKTSGIAQTAYKAARICGCTDATAYRLWNSLKDIGDLKGLVA